MVFVVGTGRGLSLRGLLKEFLKENACNAFAVLVRNTSLVHHRSRRHFALITSRRAHAPYRGRTECIEGDRPSIRRLRRLLRVRVIRWPCKTRNKPEQGGHVEKVLITRNWPLPSLRRKPESIFKRNDKIPAFLLSVFGENQSNNKNKGKINGFRLPPE